MSTPLNNCAPKLLGTYTKSGYASVIITISIGTKPVNDEMLSVSELVPASCNIFNLSRARTRQISYNSIDNRYTNTPLRHHRVIILTNELRFYHFSYPSVAQLAGLTVQLSVRLCVYLWVNQSVTNHKCYD